MRDVSIAVGLPAVFLMMLAQFTPEHATGYATAASIFIGALVLAYTNLLAARAAARKAIAPVVEKLEAIAPVVTKIEAHVNSEMTRANGELAAQKLQIDLQREMIEELKKTAGLLAQAKATTDATNAIAQAAVAGATTPPVRAVADQPLAGAPVSASLNNIDDSTKQIEKNTKRTDQAVQDLKDKP